MDGVHMEWSARRTETFVIGEPRGRVDETTWEDFLGFLTGAIADAAAAGVSFTIDLDGVDYMSSRGLRVLTIAKRDAESRHVSLILARPNARMREILSISRYDKIFKIEETVTT
jgi:anti-sigma B factor antagonist